MPPEDRVLLGYFVESVVPPIIAEIETQSKWTSMRQALLSMSRSSSMLRNAILTFSSLLLSRKGDSTGNTREYYSRTITEITRYDEPSEEKETKEDIVPNRAAMLGTLFFLSYTDLLDGRNDLTHVSLKKAYDIYQSVDKRQFLNL